MALPFTNIDILPDFARSTRLKNSKPTPAVPPISIAGDTFDKRGAARRVTATQSTSNQELAAAINRLKARLDVAKTNRRRIYDENIILSHNVVGHNFFQVIGGSCDSIDLTSTPSGSIYSLDLNIYFEGYTPRDWAAITGTLPPGLTISNSGILNGTPTTPGQYTFGINTSQ
jgi:hypothetical protein